MVDENVQHWDMINERLVYGWQKILENITSENIGSITSGRRPWVINPIFSLVMTITTSDIFQYFCQSYTYNIHKFVVIWLLCKKCIYWILPLVKIGENIITSDNIFQYYMAKQKQYFHQQWKCGKILSLVIIFSSIFTVDETALSMLHV